MINCLQNVNTIKLFIQSSDLLKDHVQFEDKKIFIDERCIAELSEDGYFRSRDLSNLDFYELRTIYKFLTLCQTYLTIESKEARLMQELYRENHKGE